MIALTQWANSFIGQHVHLICHFDYTRNQLSIIRQLQAYTNLHCPLKSVQLFNYCLGISWAAREAAFRVDIVGAMTQQQTRTHKSSNNEHPKPSPAVSLLGTPLKTAPMQLSGSHMDPDILTLKSARVPALYRSQISAGSSMWLGSSPQIFTGCGSTPTLP